MQIQHIIDVRQLAFHPGKYESSIYDDINNRIKEAYFSGKTSIVYEFENPLRLSEEFKKRICNMTQGGGYNITRKTERISLTDVLLSFEVSWEEHFQLNKHKRDTTYLVSDFYLLNGKVKVEP